MRGQSNAGGSFRAALIGEVTKNNKTSDSNFLVCEGQTLSATSYSQLAKCFPISTFGSGGFNPVQGMTTNYNIRSVVYWKNMYYAFSTSSPAIFTSSDGYYWIKNTEETDLYYATILVPYGDMLLAIGRYIYTSTDGKTFIEREDLRSEFSYYATKNNRIVIGSNVGGTVLWYSDDGINWTQENSIPDSGSDGAYSLCSNDNIFTLSKDRYVCTSENGINWIVRFDAQNRSVIIWVPSLNEFRGARQSGTITFYGTSDGSSWEYMYTNNLPFSPSASTLFIAIYKNYYIIISGAGRTIAINQYWDNVSGHSWQQVTWNINSYPYGQCLYSDNQILLYGTQSGSYVALNYLNNYNFVLPNYADNYFIRAIGGGHNIIIFFHLYFASLFISYFIKKEVREK